MRSGCCNYNVQLKMDINVRVKCIELVLSAERRSTLRGAVLLFMPFLTALSRFRLIILSHGQSRNGPGEIEMDIVGV